ncbi:hypothetical protein PsorP6_003798 [Peronosclerospora sorghi]|uniref:Uncharacterized protein n=1 Tax=Peronosclerospora sorghi TaxID=230839 RepID=A0ACC0VIV7_9STRA|nr:hypothetical protein PsorP6_003798 [Peronosclerospora sorghi]
MLRSTVLSSFFSTSVNVAICALRSSPMIDFSATRSCNSLMEEEALRAKIQAIKNFLEAKRQSAGRSSAVSTSNDYSGHDHGRYYCRKYAPVHRSWNRFFPPTSTFNMSRMGAKSTNKVWKRNDASVNTTAAAILPSTMEEAHTSWKSKAWRKPVKVPANKRKSMQLQVLRLEGSEYAKANGGFNLVRANVKKSSALNVSPAPTKVSPMPVSRMNSNSVNIGGIKYAVANGGKVLRRCSTEEYKGFAINRPVPISLATKSGAARAA